MWVGVDLLAADILVGKERVSSWFGMAVAYIQAQRIFRFLAVLTPRMWWALGWVTRVVVHSRLLTG